MKKGKERILKIFFEEPFKEYYLREISRIAKIPVDNAHKYLHYFLKKGFLNVRKEKNRSFFRANLKNEFLLKIFEYFELERRQEFFRKNPSLLKLQDITNDILTLIWEPAIVLYNRKNSEVILITSYSSESLSESKIMKILNLSEFRAIKDQILHEDTIVLYNEFLYWREKIRSY
ncbi:MAG: hypothetical protein QW802_04900 [Candidatus Altiarchaeota archaeon]